MTPIDPTFNDAVWHMAYAVLSGGWNTSDNGPSTLAKLKTVNAANNGRMVVSSQQCARTIFAHEGTNIAFRAWHDWCHLALDAEFNLAGETEVCFLQAAQFIALYGVKRSHYWRRLLRAEVIGQAAYRAATGEFPDDQVQFDLEYMKGYRQ